MRVLDQLDWPFNGAQDLAPLRWLPVLRMMVALTAGVYKKASLVRASMHCSLLSVKVSSDGVKVS